MLDEQGLQNFFEHIDNLWIKPELSQRFNNGEPPKDFIIHEALIKLPLEGDVIVEFNKEIQWELEFEVTPDVEVKEGDPVYLHEVRDIKKVFPPKINGNRVAFVYVYWTGYAYKVVFDFTPNHPDLGVDSDDFQLGVAIRDHVRAKMIERTVRFATNAKTQLGKIGLWTVTALLPYPISRIVERISVGELDEARQILVNHCDSNFIATKLVRTWYSIDVFRVRQHAFEEALTTHQSGLYHASISILISHIEGVIVDWLYELLPPDDVRWKIKSRVKQFHSALESIPQLEYAYNLALESTIEFLREGDTAPTPFQAFKNWLDTIDPNFAARHPIHHGKYVSEIYTQENSIKLFLLLDTICQFMMFYEVRVLGKDLSQNIVGEDEA